jgi:hypothetical protein
MPRCGYFFAFLLALPLALAAQANEQVVGQLGASASQTGASVKGSVVLADTGTGVVAGSTVTSGLEAATLRLTRGGEVRICQRTSVSVTLSANGRDLMFSMGPGAIETHYRLPASADTIITPDFRLLLPGPGEFHFAISTDARGDTCVRSMQSNTASVVVSELLGDGTYQVRPDEEVLFRGGRVANPERLTPPDCGCPPPVPVHQVDTAPPKPTPRPDPPTEVHVQVDAPFVFRAEADVPPPPVFAELKTQRPAPLVNLAAVLPPPPALPVTQVAAAVEPPKPPSRNLFAKIGRFFAKLFR